MLHRNNSCIKILLGSISKTYIIMKYFFDPLFPTEIADSETESAPQPHMVKQTQWLSDIWNRLVNQASVTQQRHSRAGLSRSKTNTSRQTKPGHSQHPSTFLASYSPPPPPTPHCISHEPCAKGCGMRMREFSQPSHLRYTSLQTPLNPSTHS